MPGQTYLNDLGHDIKQAIQTGPLLRSGSLESRPQHPPLPPMMRLCAHLLDAGQVSSAAYWAHLMSAIPPVRSRLEADSRCANACIGRSEGGLA